MKICVIGNSHCAALNDAWKELGPEYPGMDVTIFAAPKRMALDTRLEDGRLVPENDDTRAFFRISSGGHEHISLGEYDRFLIYGLAGQPPVEQDDNRYSKAVLAAARRARVRRSHAFQLAKVLRGAVTAPIDVAPNPFRLLVKGVKPAPNEGIVEFEHRLFGKTWQKTLNARYVAQPDETVSAGRATRPEFGGRAKRLTAVEGAEHLHDDDNDRHANAEYGKVWMKRYLDGLQASDGSAGAAGAAKWPTR